MLKLSLQYLLPGFELTTSRLKVSSLNHKTRVPALMNYLLILTFLKFPHEIGSNYLL